MDLHIQPKLGALRLDDVHVGAMDGSDAARGRLSILLDLIRDEHSLLSGGRQASLPGKFGNEVPYAVMPVCVKTFGRMCWQRLPPGGVRPHCCPAPGAGNPNRWLRPSLKTGSRRVVSHLPGKQWSHSPWPW